MDDSDLNNAIVLAIFGGSLIAIVVGYLLAWRSKRTDFRRLGSAVTAVLLGFAGLFMLAWLLGAILPLPPPDGSPLWQSLVFFLALSPLPLGAFYFSVKLLRQALRDGQKCHFLSIGPYSDNPFIMIYLSEHDESKERLNWSPNSNPVGNSVSGKSG